MKVYDLFLQKKEGDDLFMQEVYILEGARTAFGGFGQSFREVSAMDLGVVTAKEALKRAQVEPQQIDQVIYGNVIQSSTNAAYLARHIALHAGTIPEVPALMVNHLCGSGLQAVISAASSILLQEARTVLAGGVENMSQAPHADFTSRFAGKKLGGIHLEDMLLSTLTDEYIGCSMGITAENLAQMYQISREEQDEYALLSHERATRASELLAEERIGVPVRTRAGILTMDQDEQVRIDTSMDKLQRLKPVFLENGTVTAGNASTLNDGAVSLIIAGADALGGRKPLARIVSWAVAGVSPEWMGIGPVPATHMALQRAGISLDEVDLVEINEAFAAQYLAVERELGLDRERTNVNGGAIALGHPLGASGARVLLALAYELRRRGKRYGLASVCIGGGQGVTIVIENMQY